MKQLIAYFRVSTAKQGRSGLGLDAQRAAVRRYAQDKGATIRAEYTEVESGAKADRPELALAVARARMTRATLVVAKLDRLARDVRLILQLVDSGIAIHFCDLPELAGDDPAVGRLMLTLLAAVAEFERKRISSRIKAAIAQRKQRGWKATVTEASRAGFQAAQPRATKAAAVGRSKRAAQYRAEIRPLIASLGPGTLAEIAERLNGQGYTTPKGRPWSPQAVQRVVKGVG